MKHFIAWLSAASLFLLAGRLQAQGTPEGTPNEHGGMDVKTLKDANNPMASTTAINVQDFIVSSIYGAPNTTLNQFLLRVGQPFGKILVRATMPFILSSYRASPPLTGLGDYNMFVLYTLNKGSNEYGFGPNITAPTGTHGLGQGKWQAGVSLLAFLAESHIIQAGSLLQWQASFAGDESRSDVNLLIPQPFFIWQVGGGTYLRSTGIWSFDLTNGNYNVPIGLGVGKVIKAGDIVFNIFAEPQFSVLAEGAGQPKFQIFAGFNTQF